MNKLRQSLPIVFALLLLGAAGWFLRWLFKTFFAYIRDIPKEVAASLVAGIATILVATLTVMLGRYFERKKELDALHRDKKTEMYDELLRQLFQLFQTTPNPVSDTSSVQAVTAPPIAQGGIDETVQFLREFYRKQILWSGPEVIRSFGNWRANLAKGVPDADSIFLMEDFLLAVRRSSAQQCWA